MKKYTSLRKGFTLVELMIVIAIIGILAAVLYPSMTGYFERSRDTNRQTALRNITLSLATYNQDNSAYPKDPNKKCVSDALQVLVGQYIQALPKDPKNSYGAIGCTDKWGYGYRTIKDPVGTADASYVIGAKVENKANANYVGGKSSDWLQNPTAAQLGTGALSQVNNRITGGTGSTSEGTAYYVVGQ